MRLIDADALIKTIERKDICTYADTAGNTYGESDVIEYIESMPTVDPVKHGRWIPVNAKIAKCSNCCRTLNTHGADLTGKALVHKALFHYCPNCGTKMDEVSE